jgi:hypothetical protein
MSSGDAREFRASQSKTRHGLFIGAMLAVFGFWALFLAGESIPNRYWLGGLNLALGLGISLYAWVAGQSPGAALRIDDGGVWFRDWGLAVPWPAIDDVYQTGTRLQPFVTIRITDPERFVASLAENEARKLKGNRLWKSPELRIPFGVVEAPYQEILEAIKAGLRSNGD